MHSIIRQWANAMGNGVRKLKRVFSAPGSNEESVVDHLLENPLLQFVAFVVFIGALVAIVTAGFETRGSGLSRAMIGQPTQTDIRATHSFTFTETNLEASEQRRQAAAESVPPVFDWHEGMAADYRDRIGRAFSSMREALAERSSQYLQHNDPQRLSKLRESASSAGDQQALIDALPPAKRVSFARQLRGEHFSAHLEKPIPDSNFDILARHGFSASVENPLTSMLNQVMSKAIVDNDQLPQTDLDRGIYLRRLREDKLLIEYHVTDLDERLIPLRNVPGLVREAAPQALSSIQAEALRSALISSAITLAQPNTLYNQAQTQQKRQAAREAVADSAKHYEFTKGQIIVDRGHKITERHFRIIRKMHEEDQYLDRIQTGAIGARV